MIVVDACVLADALVEDGVLGASARRALAVDPHWVAPPHLWVEVLSVIRGRTLGGKLHIFRAQQAVDALAALAIDQVDPSGLVDRIWQLRDNLTTYDAAYVAVAEALQCPLVTSDGRLAKAPGIHCETRLISLN